MCRPLVRRSFRPTLPNARSALPIDHLHPNARPASRSSCPDQPVTYPARLRPIAACPSSTADCPILLRTALTLVLTHPTRPLFSRRLSRCPTVPRPAWPLIPSCPTSYPAPQYPILSRSASFCPAACPAPLRLTTNPNPPHPLLA